MRSIDEIKALMDKIDEDGNKFPGMTYEEGFMDALMWVLKEIPSDEISF